LVVYEDGTIYIYYNRDKQPDKEVKEK